MLTSKQIRFCAMECERQRTSPASVADMCDAYIYAVNEQKARKQYHLRLLSIVFVIDLGKTIEPDKNKYGFRTTPVYFGDPTRQAIAANNVRGALVSLITHGQSLTPEESYTEFERIHPFNDGNGRVGAILYNIWRGTLDDPKIPPHFPKKN